MAAQIRMGSAPRPQHHRAQDTTSLSRTRHLPYQPVTSPSQSPNRRRSRRAFTSDGAPPLPPAPVRRTRRNPTVPMAKTKGCHHGSSDPDGVDAATSHHRARDTTALLRIRHLPFPIPKSAEVLPRLHLRRHTSTSTGAGEKDEADLDLATPVSNPAVPSSSGHDSAAEDMSGQT